MATLSHCLWFDHQAEDAARFYASVFPGGRVGPISHYCGVGEEVHGQKAGTVLTAEFEILGEKYMALNGGPVFKFNEAFSIVVTCENQEEIDYYWDKLKEGGHEVECGWLKDRFGLSWQITPRQLGEMMTDPDLEKRQRVMAAFLKMKKFDLAALRRAFEGKS